jgi:hypothetical protein
MCTSTACDFNYLAILVATIAYFMIGGTWYSPVLFANAWMKESKVVPDKSKGIAQLLVVTFFITLFMVFILAYFINTSGADSLQKGLLTGLLAGLGFVATTIGITFLYEGRTIKLFLIDAGYHVTGLIVAGGILGMWR